MSSTSGRWLVAGLAAVAGGVGGLAGSAAAQRAVAGTKCPHPSVPVPRHEPKYTPGPTELVSGLYIQGGAVYPHCRPEPRGPYAGTVKVTSQQGGLAARKRVKNGHLAHVRLPPGTYTVRWKFSGGEASPRSFTVTVQQGEKVRQDGFLDAP
jgi:hypothetical protein